MKQSGISAAEHNVAADISTLWSVLLHLCHNNRSNIQIVQFGVCNQFSLLCLTGDV